MIYKVSTVYSPNEDTGILWNSLDFPWINSEPILSTRDKSFVRFSEFKSPFIFSPQT